MQDEDKEKLAKLKAALPEPAPSPDWTVFVDESHWGINYNDTVTAFYAISDQRKKKAFARYKKLIMDLDPDREVKSSQVSDRINIEALKASKGSRALYAFCCSNNAVLSSASALQKSLATCYLIETYLFPVKSLLKQIAQQFPAPEISVKIVIDRMTQLDTGSAFANAAPCFLQYLASVCSTKDVRFHLSYTSMDSPLSPGVQIADMMAGAYRKQMTYQNTDPKIKMLPISYTEIVYPNDYLHDSLFLSIYGRLAIFNQQNVIGQNNVLQTAPVHLASVLDEFRGYLKFLQDQPKHFIDTGLATLQNNYGELFSKLDTYTPPTRVTDLNVVLSDLGRYRSSCTHLTIQDEQAAISSIKRVAELMPRYAKYLQSIAGLS